MIAASTLAQQAWLTYWRARQRYHRYTVEGLEHLDSPRAAVIVGYHGRGLALDMCMLTVAIYDRLGYLPHGVVHRGLDSFPPLKRFTDALGFVTDDGEAVALAVARGEHIVVTPGGGQEGLRSVRHRYQLAWGDRMGYVRLAAKYRLPIVPVAAAGADDTYIGLNDAEWLGRRLGLPRHFTWTVWIGIGPLGLYPLSPPFPVRLHQFIGEPIDPWSENGSELGDPKSLRRVHRRVTDAMHVLLERARSRSAWSGGGPP